MHTTHMPEFASYAVYLVGDPEPVTVAGSDMETSPDGELRFSDDNGNAWVFAAGAWRYARRMEQ